MEMLFTVCQVIWSVWIFDSIYCLYEDILLAIVTDKIRLGTALPENFQVNWKKFKRNLNKFAQLEFLDWSMFPIMRSYSHEFNDSSESAYATIMYLFQSD